MTDECDWVRIYKAKKDTGNTLQREVTFNTELENEKHFYVVLSRSERGRRLH